MCQVQLNILLNLVLNCIFIIIYLLPILICVDHTNFKTCDQSSFCRRQRQFSAPEGQSQYHVLPGSVAATAGHTGLTATLSDGAAGRNLSLRIVRVSGGAFRIHLNEAEGSSGGRRYQISAGDSLLPDLAEMPVFMSLATDKGIIKLEAREDAQRAAASLKLHLQPFRVDLLLHGRTVATANSRGLLHWEFLGLSSPVAAAPEKFRDHTDLVPRGPSSIGVDVDFPVASRLYGIPEHTDRLPLTSTVGGASDPYRLYNLDVFEYELDSRMALYGSVPVLYGHGFNATAAAFWHNAAETWVDMDGRQRSRWVSESGVIDLFLMAGPTPLTAVGQFATLVGTTPLPPLFALGYHQSRWNYNDEADALEVNRRFDEAEFPYDALWLDIEHTDGKRCFTWDAVKFPDPQRLINHLEAAGRKLVTIVDPHVKRDSAWSVYQEVRDRRLAVQRPDGSEFDGWCWPGSSVWPDFLNADVRSWWSRQFLTYPAAFTWNDMNEPSVFSGPEVTMPKDLLHSGGWEHRDVHNLYGALVHRASWEGQLLRSPSRRPFVLTRALFAGSQRTAATWTGDNAARWSHLRASEPMLMSLGLAGVTLAGADVGGFFGDPDPELLVRWYQAGAMQPFFRAHAHLDSKRREPWLFDRTHMETMRAAVLLRYSLMPYIYTQFYLSQGDGRPVMAPLWFYFPADAATFDLDDQHLLGADLLFKPVAEPGVNQIRVYLPAASSWYLYESWRLHSGPAWVSLPVSLASAPLFMRAGSVVARREISAGRRSLQASLEDPIGLVVLAGPVSGAASGLLYTDDGTSLGLNASRPLLVDFAFSHGLLVSHVRSGGLGGRPAGPGDFVVSVAFVGLPARPAGFRIAGGLGRGMQASSAAELRYDAKNRVAIVRRLRLPLAQHWQLRLLSPLAQAARDEL